jgi:hypothetical protein
MKGRAATEVASPSPAKSEGLATAPFIKIGPRSAGVLRSAVQAAGSPGKKRACCFESRLCSARVQDYRLNGKINCFGYGAAGPVELRGGQFRPY